MSELLVVAGEASGDRAAAAVARPSRRRARASGSAARPSRAPGVELVGDMRASTALGIGEAAARAGSVLRAWRARRRAPRASGRPRAALLVNYTEFNARLAPRAARGAGVRVLWYGAPQVWAWRAAPRRRRSAARRPHGA